MYGLTISSWASSQLATYLCTYSSTSQLSMLLLLFMTYPHIVTSLHTLKLEFYQFLSPYIIILKVGRNNHLRWLMVGSANGNSLSFIVVSTCTCMIARLLLPGLPFLLGFLLTVPVPATCRHSCVSLHTALGCRVLVFFLSGSTSSIRLMIRAHLEEPLRLTLMEDTRFSSHVIFQ